MQYCAVNKSPCGQASITGDEGKQVTGFECSIVLQINLPVGRPALQVMRENRLQVEGSIML